MATHPVTGSPGHVETPAHALATLQACDVGAACVGEYLVERS
ncbi:hypothetical protein [Streptomyces fructofermentans]|nr:hypothetical protein [Streptomyces fructofermentans]